MQRATDSGERGPEPHDPYEPLRHRDFRLYLAGNLTSILGSQMLAVAVAWEVYARTGQPLKLAWVGLCQVVPLVAVSPLAGPVADRFDPRKVLATALGLMSFCWAGLAAVSWFEGPLVAIYGCLAAAATARGFHLPAKAALMPHLVPRHALPSAVTMGTGGFHLASVLGPALAGALVEWVGTPAVVYAITVGTCLSFAVVALSIRRRQIEREAQAFSLDGLLAGARFLVSQPVLLAAMTLDLFAVLLGGATALLPVYAKDILDVGASGMGWLRSASAIGAVVMAVVLAYRPPLARAGRALLWAVAGFGAATIVFGVSTSFWLSFGMLVLIGALDNVSVVVRHSLVHLHTPDAMRGRVSAINGVFIAASNELGEVESGVVAHFTTPVFAVVSGGVGTIAVVLLAARRWPQLRRYGRLGAQAVTAPAAVAEERVAAG